MTSFREASHIAYSTKELNMMADVQRELKHATCQECGGINPIDETPKWVWDEAKYFCECPA